MFKDYQLSVFQLEQQMQAEAAMPEFIKERVRNMNDRLFNTSVAPIHQVKLHKKEDQLKEAVLRHLRAYP